MQVVCIQKLYEIEFGVEIPVNNFITHPLIDPFHETNLGELISCAFSDYFEAFSYHTHDI